MFHNWDVELSEKCIMVIKSIVEEIISAVVSLQSRFSFVEDLLRNDTS